MGKVEREKTREEAAVSAERNTSLLPALYAKFEIAR